MHLGNICWVPREQALAAFELTYLKNELDFTAYCFSDSFFICAFARQKGVENKMDAKFIC